MGKKVRGGKRTLKKRKNILSDDESRVHLPIKKGGEKGTTS